MAEQNFEDVHLAEDRLEHIATPDFEATDLADTNDEALEAASRNEHTGGVSGQNSDPAGTEEMIAESIVPEENQFCESNKSVDSNIPTNLRRLPLLPRNSVLHMRFCTWNKCLPPKKRRVNGSSFVKPATER